MPINDRDTLVADVLARMDRHERRMQLLVIGAAVVEALLMIVAVLKVDWHDDTQSLLFIFSVLSYTLLALGMMALGTHVSRVGARVVAALAERESA